MTAVAHDFPSTAWVDAYGAVINASEDYRAASAEWTHGSVALVLPAVALFTLFAFVAYELNRRNEYLGAWIDHCGWSPQWRLRLARRGQVRFTGHGPHDAMVADGRVGRLTGRLCHRPYRDLADHVAKINRYTDTSARERHAAGERAGLGQLVLRPPARFLRMYVLRAGFLDGWRGLLVSALGGVYVLLKYAKLRELGRKA